MSWIRDTWKTVVGAAASVAQPVQGSEGTSRLDSDAGAGAAGAAEGAAGTDKANSLTGSASLSNSASLDWREATAGYFRSVKDTVEEKLGAKDSGFAIVDKAEAGHQRGDYDRERADIELKCRSLMSPGSKDATTSEVWRVWLDRLRTDTAPRFYNAALDDNVSFQQILLSSPAVETAVSCLLKSGKGAKDDSAIIKLLDGCLVGEPDVKRRVLRDLVKLGEVIEGTNAQDQITKMACSAFVEARVDLEYEEKVWEVGGMLEEARAALKEEGGRGRGGSGGDEQDDEELKRRVARSSEMLDRNATTRHLVTVSRALLQARGGSDGVLGTAQERIASLSAAARENHDTASGLLEAALKEKSGMSQDAELSRAKLEEQDGALSERLERLHTRKRELQDELERVMGEILGAEQQQQEVKRERDALGRMVSHKTMSLEDTMQALSVQIQDYDNEEDALEEASGFFKVISGMASWHKAEAEQETRRRMKAVMSDQYELIELHLGHQLCQLRLLGNCMRFCAEEAEGVRGRAHNMARLGMSEMAAEEGERLRRLEGKMEETGRRVMMIESDLRDVKRQVMELALAVSTEFGGDDGMDASTCRIHALIARVEEQLSEAGLSGDVDSLSEDGAVLVSEAGSTDGSPPVGSESNVIRSGGGTAAAAAADEWSGGPRLETSNLEPTGGHVNLRVTRGGGANHDESSVPATHTFSSITIDQGSPAGHHPPPANRAQSPPSKEQNSTSSPASPAVPLTASTPFKAESPVREPTSSSSPIREPTSPYIPPKPPLFDLQSGSVVLEPALKMSSPIREPALKPPSPPAAPVTSSVSVAPHEEQGQKADPVACTAAAAAATTTTTNTTTSSAAAADDPVACTTNAAVTTTATTTTTNTTTSSSAAADDDDDAAAPVDNASDLAVVDEGNGEKGSLTGGGGEGREGAGKTGIDGDAGRGSEAQVCGDTAVLEAKKEGAVDEGEATAPKGDAAAQGAEGGGKPKGKKGKKKK